MVIFKWIKGFIKHPFRIIYSLYLRTLNKQNILATKRLAICNNCEHRKQYGIIGDICDSCGCILENKTRLFNESCDMDKW